MLKKDSLFACFAFPEGAHTCKSVIPTHSAAIPRPVGSLAMFVTCRYFYVTKAVPLIIVPTFVYVLYPGGLPRLGWVTSCKNRMSRSW